MVHFTSDVSSSFMHYSITVMYYIWKYYIMP